MSNSDVLFDAFKGFNERDIVLNDFDPDNAAIAFQNSNGESTLTIAAGSGSNRQEIRISGTDFVVNSQRELVSGTVEEVVLLNSDGGFGRAWRAKRVEVDAGEVYNAILSRSVVDDGRLIEDIFSGNDRFRLSNDRDVVSGFDGRDKMSGEGGNDRLSGNGGRDDIDGGRGNDTIFGGAGSDDLDGGRGNDRVEGGSGGDTILGDDGRDDLRGDDGKDTIRGGSGDDEARGGDDNDNIRGNGGDDTLRGDGGRDELRGDGGDDVLRGGDSRDELRGDSGDDRLIGGEGDDELKGGSGDDLLRGETGKDILTGGNGDDIFDFDDRSHSREGNQADDITDFERGEDVIDLEDLFQGTLNFIGQDAFDRQDGQVRIEDTGSDLTIEIDLSGNGQANMAIDVLDIGTLRAGDFLL
ncbi:MAG: calcium-binding protein [Pseudomonadota bacterium]